MTEATIPAAVLDSVKPQRQRVVVSLSGRDEPVACRYLSRETRTMQRGKQEIEQCFAKLGAVDADELGGEELTLTWTAGKYPATLLGCLWVWDSEVESYRWDFVRVTAIDVDSELQQSQ